MLKTSPHVISQKTHVNAWAGFSRLRLTARPVIFIYATKPIKANVSPFSLIAIFAPRLLPQWRCIPCDRESITITTMHACVASDFTGGIHPILYRNKIKICSFCCKRYRSRVWTEKYQLTLCKKKQTFMNIYITGMSFRHLSAIFHLFY